MELNKVRVLFVCMGNICRSPLAHGFFEQWVEQAGLGARIEVDSAGTHSYHVGEPPDERARQSALRRGFDIGQQRARRAQASDFEHFDYVLAMDDENYHSLERLSSVTHKHKLKLFLEFAPHLNEREVPDPYYGGASGFERVIDLVEEAARGLLADIRQRHLDV